MINNSSKIPMEVYFEQIQKKYSGACVRLCDFSVTLLKKAEKLNIGI